MCKNALPYLQRQVLKKEKLQENYFIKWHTVGQLSFLFSIFLFFLLYVTESVKSLFSKTNQAIKRGL